MMQRLKFYSLKPKPPDVQLKSYLAVWKTWEVCVHTIIYGADTFTARQHYSDVIMGTTASQITSLTIVTQPFIQAHIKENIKALRHWPLWGELTGHRWIPCTKASNEENVSIWWRHHGVLGKMSSVRPLNPPLNLQFQKKYWLVVHVPDYIKFIYRTLIITDVLHKW